MHNVSGGCLYFRLHVTGFIISLLIRILAYCLKKETALRHHFCLCLSTCVSLITNFEEADVYES